MPRSVFERSGPVTRSSRSGGALPSGMRISDKDRGAAARITALLDQGVLKVGILEAEAAEEHEDADGATVGEIAEIHEFGLGVPQRSFLRGWVDEDKAQ